MKGYLENITLSSFTLELEPAACCFLGGIFEAFLVGECVLESYPRVASLLYELQK